MWPLPQKNRKILIWILKYYAVLLLVILLFSQAVSAKRFTIPSLIQCASFAALLALIAGIGYWLGGRFFFPVYTGGLACGVLYMLYALIFHTSSGWGGVQGLLGLLSVSGLGLISGLTCEYFNYLLKTRLRGQS